MLTRKQAAARGFTIREGAYSGTSDDVVGTYYVDHADEDLWDRRGRGWPSVQAALASIERATDTDGGAE